MPKIDGVLESVLYVDDLERARGFYEEILGLDLLYADQRMRAYAIERDVLLLFQRGGSAETIETRGGTIPGHDGSGPLHMAFAIAPAELALWEQHLQSHGIVIEGRIEWPRGGRSIYFRDLDGHLLELATPGLWANY